MPDLHIFKAQVGMVEPIALQDQNVCIHYVQNEYYRKVDFLESIPPFQCIDIGAVGALATSARTNVINLEMPNNEFGLFRWYPIDDAQIRLYHPSGVAKWQLRWLQVPIDMNIVNRDPNLVSTEIAVWQNNRPAVEAINGHAFGLNAVRIIALGYRVHTLEIKDEKLIAAMEDGSQPCTHLWCSGRGIGD